jgi:hypothetical protein
MQFVPSKSNLVIPNADFIGEESAFRRQQESGFARVIIPCFRVTMGEWRCPISD